MYARDVDDADRMSMRSDLVQPKFDLVSTSAARGISQKCIASFGQIVRNSWHAEVIMSEESAVLGQAKAHHP